MHCLWHWATAKTPVNMDNSQPVMLRRVKGLLCADIADLEVGGEYKLRVYDHVCYLNTQF